MLVPPLAAMQFILQVLLALVAVFLILLVLVQRGRGGGLAGALGGMGGSSAFGAKAGDVFTRITIVAAAFWIILCIVAAKLGPATAGSRLNTGNEAPVSTGPALTPPAQSEDADEPASAGGAGSAGDATTDAPSASPEAPSTNAENKTE